MRKLLHLVFAVWKTNRPVDENHFAWETPNDDAKAAATANVPAGSATNGTCPPKKWSPRLVLP
jgi:hypothetical protein